MGIVVYVSDCSSFTDGTLNFMSSGLRYYREGIMLNTLSISEFRGDILVNIHHIEHEWLFGY